ncbi:Transcription elongation factor spt6 [Cyphellophora attinorum]|uniref:Transcription elongation factor spt6 n=1 Tax=Cyphellophora attinorum TaxID=1664694 RepID=A0A0N1H2X5_9EURO|nr:Transcription elongation factor spt6 [Phialophora attinorum]KPI35737.1 Transcription elongation factor spt6 [Phialophora attinorum]
MVAVVEPDQWHDNAPNISPKELFSLHQTVQAHITTINRKEFTCSVSLRDDAVKKPYKRFDPEEQLKYDEWDSRAEDEDKKKLAQQNPETGNRATRVIKHALFQPFNSVQAEQYLGSQNRGDAVIRPSSKGTDHLAVTWKVADGIFQHIDVLELDKENEFSLGKILRIGSSAQYQYVDLDQLIAEHVRPMAKMVEQMVNSDKFHNKSKAQLEEWLNTYTAANPKRSMYQFCLNREKPGYFHLIFKAGHKAKSQDWPVKVTPGVGGSGAFELRGQGYPSMQGLSNGFKILFGNIQGTNHALGGGR